MSFWVERTPEVRILWTTIITRCIRKLKRNTRIELFELLTESIEVLFACKIFRTSDNSSFLTSRMPRVEITTNLKERKKRKIWYRIYRRNPYYATQACYMWQQYRIVGHATITSFDNQQARIYTILPSINSRFSPRIRYWIKSCRGESAASDCLHRYVLL